MLTQQAELFQVDGATYSTRRSVNVASAPQLAKRILAFVLTIETVQDELAKEAHSLLDRAFRTILRNRTFHGGILAPGSGLIKNGEAGRGIASRWYPETLARRLATLDLVRHKLTVLTGDAFELIAPYLDRASAAFFIDPPYSAGGKMPANACTHILN